jgi:hypothetical protein
MIRVLCAWEEGVMIEMEHPSLETGWKKRKDVIKFVRWDHEGEGLSFVVELEACKGGDCKSCLNKKTWRKPCSSPSTYAFLFSSKGQDTSFEETSSVFLRKDEMRREEKEKYSSRKVPFFSFSGEEGETGKKRKVSFCLGKFDAARRLLLQQERSHALLRIVQEDMQEEDVLLSSFCRLFERSKGWESLPEEEEVKEKISDHTSQIVLSATCMSLSDFLSSLFGRKVKSHLFLDASKSTLLHSGGKFSLQHVASKKEMRQIYLSRQVKAGNISNLTRTPCFLAFFPTSLPPFLVAAVW